MKRACFPALLALMVAFVPSCVQQRPQACTAASYEMGSVSEVVYGTVTKAARIQVDSPESSRGIGTVVGGATGFGAGMLLGSGAGRVVSSVGFSLLGGIIGQNVGDAAGKSEGQELFIKADKDGRILRIQQPIFAEFGEIPVGTHGFLSVGGARNMFRPDGH